MTTARDEREDAADPASVVPGIETRDDLDAYLRWFGSASMWFRVPNSARLRRRHVELTRPALRWWCRELRVPVPAFLSARSDARHLRLPLREHLATFGRGALDIRTFPRRRR